VGRARIEVFCRGPEGERVGRVCGAAGFRWWREGVVALALATVLGFSGRPVRGQSNEWAWMGGSKTEATWAVYGNVGVPASSSTPGSRIQAVTWTDGNGNFWLFGGQGLGVAA